MTRRPPIVSLIAGCEVSRLRLAAGITMNLHGDDLTALVATRVAALEALAEHQGLMPTSPFAFTPPADRTRRIGAQPGEST